MVKLISPVSEEYAYKSSLTFNGIAGFFVLLLLIGVTFPSTGFGMFAVILGPVFLIIAFIRNTTLIAKVTSKRRRIYAITASIITGLPVVAFFVLIFRDVR